MADDGEGDAPPEKPFHVDRAKSGRAGCKKCKQKIGTGELRLAKLGYNPFGSGTMKMWHHVPCMFEVFKKQRKTTKKIDTPDDIGGWDDISQEDKDTIMGHFSPEELDSFKAAPAVTDVPSTSSAAVTENKDDSFRVFRKICSELTNASSYLTKTSIVKDFFEKGSDGNGFKGDLELWCRSLLPMAAKRIYNLQSKQLVKIFSDIFRADQDEMLEDLAQGDVAETVGSFFEKSRKVSPVKKASLTLQQVDSFLDRLSKLTREADQTDHFKDILTKCTTNDLKIIIRLIKHDLRINAGPKHILEALHPDAYQAFQTSRDLAAVVKNAVGSTTKVSNKTKGMSVGVSIMTPVLPMLAEACKSVEQAFKRCPNGMFSEIKYDGERLQLHKQGDDFKYFSRSLKPVLPHKVRHFHEHIPQAFPHGKDLILDSEILMVDTRTGQPLPFGTLGKHKKAQFKDASVCLFVFDCIYFNGKSLIDAPTTERRKVLRENMTEIPNHVMFSEMEEIHKREDLEGMMERVFRQGLEGLVLKGLDTPYRPGKRHWLKVKKDYLFGGAMADSADLVVLGAWYGTGKKGGIMSIFLMGCFDERRKKWLTVTKVHGGHDDQTLERLQTELKMVKVARDGSNVPSWLHCNKTMVPDFVAEDPHQSAVWEITGAEFTCNQVHTADGISIRFPRVTRIRDDKDSATATNLAELKQLYAKSKDTSDFTLQRGNHTAQPGPSNTQDNDDGGDDDYGDETEGEAEEEEENKAGSPTKGEAKTTDKPESNGRDGTKRKIEDYDIDTDSDTPKTPDQKRSNSDDTNRKRDDKNKGKDEEDSKSSRNKKVVSISPGRSKNESSKSPERHKKQKSRSSDRDEKESSESPKSARAGSSERGRKQRSKSPEKYKNRRSKSPEREERERSESPERALKEPSRRERKQTSKSPEKHRKRRSMSPDTDEKERSRSPAAAKGESSRKEKKQRSKSPERRKKRRSKSPDRDKKPRSKSPEKARGESSSKKDKKQRSKSPERSKKQRSRSSDTDEEQRSKKPESSRKDQKRGDSSKIREPSSSSESSRKQHRDGESSKKRPGSSSSDSSPKKKRKKEKPKEDSGSDTEVDEDLKKRTGPKIEMKNTLPDVFVGDNILLHRKIVDLDVLRRFIIAYGGRLYDKERNTSLINGRGRVTHVVYPQTRVKEKLNYSGVAHVNLDWLWDSIKAVRKLPEDRYKVRLDQ